MKSTRRCFLKSTLGAPLVGALGIPGARILRALPQAQEFENPRFIRYDASCFTINDRDTFIFSAAFHYPRCPKQLWRDRLEKLKRAGFNTIETYVFWNYHEREEGKCDLGDFEEFIKLVGEMGFLMIARPGPYISAEWHRGGIPDWVAAKRFPLRSNHPENLKWSQHWYGQVMPVIARHQISMGGPIFMVQIENEYDFWPLPDSDKREYVRALANLCAGMGIIVPLFTCWTRQARENSDPDMARIFDTCNFYPRWEIASQVTPALAKLRQEEPNAPLGVSELQGGWFSQFGGEEGRIPREEIAEIVEHMEGPQKPTVDEFMASFNASAGKLSVDQPGIDAAQLNALTKTVIEQGVTYSNYYMGAGGTNFNWAARTQTTTYDYAAPLREPGGLWEKYYAARGIGASLALFGNVLTRAKSVPNIPQSTNPNVSVTERAATKAGVVFVRENANAEQRFKMYFQDPFSPTKRVIGTPREGELTIGPREMKMLPVGIRIPGSVLRYTTAEVLAAGLLLDRHVLIVYDEPGRLVEISVASEDEPKIEGDYVYNYWDQEYESVVLGVRVDKADKTLLVNHHLHIVVVSRERALRSWTAEFPPKVIIGAEETRPMMVPFITDSYQLAGSGSDAKHIWADLDFRPGEHALTVLLPPAPSKLRVDGVLTGLSYDRPSRITRLNLTTPPLSDLSVSIREVKTWTEKFEPSSGEWTTTVSKPLEELGAVPYGYVKYRAEFNYSGEPVMSVTSFGREFKQVFLNGKAVPEAANNKISFEFPLRAYAKPGANLIEISYECFGSSSGGPSLGALRGIDSVRYGRSAQDVTAISTWQIQRFPGFLRGPEIDPQIAQAAEKNWQAQVLETVSPSKDLVPAFTWCWAEFAVPTLPAGWMAPWKLTFEAERDALLYLNGKFVGRYVTAGPQKDFYLPEPFLLAGQKNELIVILAYADHPGSIRALRVEPYAEFAARRTRIEFEY
ncbi:MAG: beta-galactosidase [Terriglobia bacterium]